MYMVISKPKRMSVAAGVSHFIRILLSVSPAKRVRYWQHICQHAMQCAGLLHLPHRQNMDSGLAIFIGFVDIWCLNRLPKAEGNGIRLA